MQSIIIILLTIILAALLFLLLQNVRRTSKSEELRLTNARLETELESERKNMQEKLRLLEDTESRLKIEFENLANRIFEEKGRAFSSQNAEKLSSLLNPFREQIEAFRKRVDEVHRNDIEGFSKLLEQVRQLQELNSKVSEEANNLALAIKGDAKAQGGWGELIVERIFEASGLECEREYDTQVSVRSEDGKLFKPDFVVYLPGNKAVIVDSKVSLTAYERFCNERDETPKASALSEHLLSVRKHIDELKEKKYHQLLGNKTLDFVIMCVPVEGAYQLALQEDKNLLYDVARDNIVLTGPATLMLMLKLIAQIWRREKENRNAETIADRAGRLYDQVSLVYEAMTDAKKKLVGVQDLFDTAMNRLRDGKGNLIGRVEELRKLGAKTSKQIPQEPAENSDAQQLPENG
jgi:DNA recombination protein RmuC